MTPGAALPILFDWTPFLPGGFLWNILVSLVAMAVGTLLGAGLALARAEGGARLRHWAAVATHGARNVPTFVFLYYLAYLLPFELELGGRLLTFPAWVKAALALSIAVVGFVSDNLLDALAARRRGDMDAAMLFIPNWTMYFVIIVMASSTASVIGVPELVARTNTVIGAVGDDRLMLWIYAWAMVWFFAFCAPVSWLMRRLKARLAQRHAAEIPA